MSRFETLKELVAGGGKLLVPFFTGCYPDGDTFVELLLAAQSAGADALEVGIPFSDPSADGPIIQAASQKTLEAGTTVDSIMACVKRARERGLALPLLYMTYYNPILHRGGEKFSREAIASGADGVLVVDLPPEEAEEFAPIARANGLDTIFLIAPTTPEERYPLVLSRCSGFLYVVSVTGVTGGKEAAVDTVGAMTGKLKDMTDLPVLAGFGVNNAASAKAISTAADGVIVGSAIMKLVGEAGPADAPAKVAAFIQGLRAALDG